MPNRIAALVQYLKDDDIVAPMVTAEQMGSPPRVFPHELPDSQAARMPRSCLVVMYAGGGQSIGAGGNEEYSDRRIDIRHYAWTLDSASDLYDAVYAALRRCERVVVGDCLIHWCRPAGGPHPLRDPPVGFPPTKPADNRVHWPFVNASWQVLAADIPVPVPA